jgi:3-dehydroquinate synthase
VLEGLAKPGRLEGPDPSLLAAAYSEIAEVAP